jgi:hypothetical protein
MSDTIHPTPQAPRPTSTSPASASASTPEPHNFSRPGTARASTQYQTVPAPVPANATVTTPTPFPTTAPHNATAATEEPQTLNDKLNTADRYWKFKAALQTIAIIIGFIGIGTLGWICSTGPRNNLGYGYDEYDSYFPLWSTLITFSISIVWCLTCILVFVLRKRSVHPGLRVALELLLWLGFIVTALFAIGSFINIVNWGEGGDLGFGYGNSYGDYVLKNNGTWVWEDSSSSEYTTYSRSCNGTQNANSPSWTYYYDSGFKDCAEQDAYVNALWRAKPHRTSVELTGVVCQFIALLLHFTLFVWACVDCNRFNRSKTSKDAEKLAANIVQTMITNGAVIPPPGQAHVRPGVPWGQQGMGYYQLPANQQGQGYPMAMMYPQGMPVGQQPQYYMPTHGAGPAAEPARSSVAGPSNEKTEGPRYA